ncbi:MAG: DUF2304 domain-containing protein [Acidobacteria bacterium]|nr:DUF2304 domain-containing protein [Acidobacteriota bacterium]
MDRLLLLTTLIAAGLIVTVLVSLRRAHIRVEYSVSWLIAAVILLLLAQLPEPLRWFASWAGIQDPPTVLLFLVAGVFLVVFYRFSIIISHLRDANIALAQRVAILEFRLENVEDGRL